MTLLKKSTIWRTHCIGEINAGAHILPFTPQRQPVTLFLPENLVAKEADIIILRVVGDSMSGARLENGDYLICRRHFEKSEIRPDTVCAVMIKSLNSLVAKRIRPNATTVTLLSANDDYPPTSYPADDVEIYGIAVGGAFYF